METTQTTLADSLQTDDWFAHLLERATIAQLRVMRERIDLALVLRADEVRADKERVKQEEREAKEALRALGIKKPRKVRKDKGTKRTSHEHTSPTEDQQ